MHEDRFHFERGAIRPFQCIAEGWRLVKEDYWFFLGVCLVGLLLAELAPFGILMGPALCGIHICLLRQANGQPVKFDMLFQGFNYFAQSLIATLFIMAPILLWAIVYVVMIVFAMVFFLGRMAAQQQGDEAGLYFISMYIGATVIFVLGTVPMQMLFIFVFPLIVDRELTGWEAVKTSSRAVMSNLGGVFAIIFLEFLIGLLGLLLCYIGVIFVLPLTFAMTAIAFRQVFPVQDSYISMTQKPDELGPAPVVVDHSPHIQVGEPRPTGVQDRAPDSGPSPEASA